MGNLSDQALADELVRLEAERTRQKRDRAAREG